MFNVSAIIVYLLSTHLAKSFAIASDNLEKNFQLQAVVSQTLVSGHGGEGQGIEVEVNDKTEGEEELSVVEGCGLLKSIRVHLSK